jgi:hypothetical protein
MSFAIVQISGPRPLGPILPAAEAAGFPFAGGMAAALPLSQLFQTLKKIRWR